jgi:hypothetical protein
MSRAPKTRLPFPDLPADADPNLLARAHAEVSDWAEGKTREEIIARLVEVRADYLRALRDLKAALRRLHEFEAARAGAARGGRGRRRESARAQSATEELAKAEMLEWLKTRWKRGLWKWSEITREDRAELYQRIREKMADANAVGAAVEVRDRRTLDGWLRAVFEQSDRASWGVPGRPRRR